MRSKPDCGVVSGGGATYTNYEIKPIAVVAGIAMLCFGAIVGIALVLALGGPGEILPTAEKGRVFFSYTGAEEIYLPERPVMELDGGRNSTTFDVKVLKLRNKRWIEQNEVWTVHFTRSVEG